MRVRLAAHVSTLFGRIFGKDAFDVTTNAAAVRFDYTSTGPDQVTSPPGRRSQGTRTRSRRPALGPLPCGLSSSGSTTTLPGQVTTIGTGSNLDE